MDDEVSVLGVVRILMRWRRLLVGLGILGAVLGLSIGLLSTRVYQSSAVFLPEAASGTDAGGLIAAASQFGIRLPSGGGSWGSPVYVELLESPALLGPIAHDTLAVAEEGGRRVPVMDLLKIRDKNPAMRTELAIRALNRVVTATEVRPLQAVKITVVTPWPSVSYQLTRLLLDGLNRFILEKRKSQATAELQFVESQARDADTALRAAEDRLQGFLQQNRSIGGSPELTFAHDRLQRDVSLKQQLYSTLLQSREEARVRQVRDTPVITVLEEPRLPVVGEPRNSIQKAILGAIVGGLLGVIIALLSERLGQLRRTAEDDVPRFFSIAHGASSHVLHTEEP